MRRRSKSCESHTRNIDISRLRRTNSHGDLPRLRGMSRHDYDVYNDIVDHFNIQESDLSNHIRHLEIRNRIGLFGFLNTGIIMTIGRCKKYTTRYPLPVPLPVDTILCNSLGNLLRIRSLSIDITCSVNVTILNRLTRLRVLSLYNVCLITDDSTSLILPKLRSLSADKCRLLDSTTYDLLLSLNKYSTNIEYISIYRMIGEDIHKMQIIPNVSDARPLPVNNMSVLTHLQLEECYLNAFIPDDCMSKLVGRASYIEIRSAVLIHEPPYNPTTNSVIYTINTRKLYINTIEVQYYDLKVINSPSLEFHGLR